MKKIIILFAALCITLITRAYDFTVNGIFYNITSSSSPYTVAVSFDTSSASGYTGAVVIPASVTYNSNSYSVGSVGDYAFAKSTGLTSVTIPSSVTSIGSYAFYSCTGLSTVSIPSSDTSIGTWAFLSCSGLTSVDISASVTSIGDGAFWGCTGLTTLAIPASVKKLGNYVFFGCTGLTQINADAANTNFISADGILYNKTKSILLVYPSGRADASYTIASTVDTIGAYAFGYCNNLTSITIPTSVVYMTHAAFCECNGLTTVFIPATVTFFNNNPFYDCKGMTAVNVDPANQYNESVDGVLFKKGLTTIIYYPPAKSGNNYVIPSTVTYIRSAAFMNSLNLTTVSIPASVTTIRDHMFSGCTGLSTINAYPAVPVDLSPSTSETSNDVFLSVDTTTCVLHVSVGSRSLYASAAQWKAFTNIVEGFSTAVNHTTLNNVKASVSNGLFIVSGTDAGETITVYNIQGIAIYSHQAEAETTSISLPARGVYVLKVGAESIKFVY
jgi:hypothetical protein